MHFYSCNFSIGQIRYYHSKIYIIIVKHWHQTVMYCVISINSLQIQCIYFPKHSKIHNANSLKMHIISTKPSVSTGSTKQIPRCNNHESDGWVNLFSKSRGKWRMAMKKIILFKLQYAVFHQIQIYITSPQIICSDSVLKEPWYMNLCFCCLL